MRIRLTARVVALAMFAVAVQAHVGSPDVYFDGKAGPYQLFVTVRPPVVIPGVAELEVRSQTGAVREIQAVPTPMIGPGAKFAPVPDDLKRSSQDPQFFTGSLWIMTPGSWQVRLIADGQQGRGVVAVPLPAAAQMTKKMQTPLAVMLAFVALFLIAGLAAIVGASVREAKLEPGVVPNPEQKRTGRRAAGIALLVVGTVLWYGNSWWNSEAASYTQQIYTPLQMRAAINDSGMLTLNVSDPGWLVRRPGPLRRASFARTMDDLIPDHDHLMHLYMIREPGLDVVYHVHPEPAASGVFEWKLASMPAGTYKLYADIVHANGFPETMVASFEIPKGWQGAALHGDDSTGTSMPWENASITQNVFLLPDHYHMEWLRGPEPLKSKQPMLFRFRLVDQQGRAPQDMRFYMGMLGHAAFVKSDGSVFAHIHPTGSVSMAAFMLAENQIQGSRNVTATDMSGMGMSAMGMPEMDHGVSGTGSLPNEVSFPYGFPTAGRYRIIVQIKHGNTIETGIFDAQVQ